MRTTNIPFFNMKKKNTLNYPKSAAMGFFQGTQERVRKSCGKRAISVRAIEILLTGWKRTGHMLFIVDTSLSV